MRPTAAQNRVLEEHELTGELVGLRVCLLQFALSLQNEFLHEVCRFQIAILARAAGVYLALLRYRIPFAYAFSLVSLPPAFSRPTLDEKISEQVAI